MKTGNIIYRLWIALFLLIASAGTAQAVQWKLKKSQFKAGKQDTLLLQIDGNSQDFCAFQVDLSIPKGVLIQKQAYLSDLANGHSLSWLAKNDSVYRCIVYAGADNANLKQQNGTVLEIPVMIASDFTSGTFKASGLLADQHTEKLTVTDLTETLTVVKERVPLTVNVYGLEQSVETGDKAVEITYTAVPDVALTVNYYKDAACQQEATEADRKQIGTLYVKLSYAGDESNAPFEQIYPLHITNKKVIGDDDIVPPTTTSIVKGQRLSASILSGGNANYKETVDEVETTFPVPGTFAWTVDTLIAHTAGDAVEFSATFYPENATRFAKKEVKVEVKVLDTYQVTTSATDGGTIKMTGKTEDDHYIQGQQITLQAIPYPNYQFEGWSGIGSGSADSITVPVAKSGTYIARFQPITHKVSYSQQGNGSLSISANEKAVANNDELMQGTVLQIKATPAEGYQLETLTVNNEPLAGDKWKVLNEVTVAVAFSRIPEESYPVTIPTTDNGSVLVYTDKGEPVASGSTLKKGSRFSVVTLADAGYETGSITVDGATADAKNIYTVGSSDITATATFTKKSYTVAATAKWGNNAAATDCSITLSKTGKVQYGETVTITDIKGDYTMLLANGKEIGRNDVLTVTGDLTVTGIFLKRVDIKKEYIMWPYQRYYYNGVSRNFEAFATQTYAGFSFKPTYVRIKDGNGKAVSGEQPLAEGPQNAGTYNVQLSRDADELYNAFYENFEEGLIIDKAALWVTKAPENPTDATGATEGDGLETNLTNISIKKTVESNFYKYVINPVEATDQNNFNGITYYYAKPNAPKKSLTIGSFSLLRSSEEPMGYVRITNGGMPYTDVTDGKVEIPEGIEVTLEAVAAPNCKFTEWSDGVTQNPRQYSINDDADVTPKFTKKAERTITLANNSSEYTGEEQLIALQGAPDEKAAYKVTFHTDKEGETAPTVLKNAGVYYVKVHFPEDETHAEMTQVLKQPYTITPKQLQSTEVTLPTASEVLKGKTLADAELLGGNAGVVTGLFTWEKADTKLETAGNSSHNVVFTPSDPNYLPYTAKVDVMVIDTKAPEEVAVSGITINPNSVTVKEGATAQLTANITPENATNKTVTWTISDKAIATITDGGLVTGVKAGTATVTATTSNGKSATCTITVEKKDTPVDPDPENPPVGPDPDEPSDPSEPDDPSDPSDPSDPDEPTDVETIQSAVKIYAQRQCLVIDCATPTHITIIEMTGVTLYNNTLTDSNFIPMPRAGIYLVKYAADQTTGVKKIAVF